MRTPRTNLITGYAVIFTVALLAIGGLTAWGWVRLQNTTSRQKQDEQRFLKANQEETIALLRSDALAECKRVQGVRDELNRNSKIIHDVLQASGKELLGGGTAPATLSVRHLRRATHSAAQIYLAYANLEQYHPPTDCPIAVVEGTRYQRPPDVPFPRVP